MSDHFHVHESVRDYHKGIKPKSHFHSIELKINLPIFYGYNNVEEFHRVEEFRRLSTTTSSFQEYAMSWWKQRQYDVSIGRKFKILNWKEFKASMRRKFVPPSYLENREEKKKKIERINRLEKHLAHLGHELKGIKLIEEKLNRMIHKEKERKEKEQKERWERKEQERQDKNLSRAKPYIDIKSSSLEPSCEKLSEPLSGVELDVDSSSIEKYCEELIEDKPLSKDIDTNSSYTEKSSEEIFVEQFCLGLS